MKASLFDRWAPKAPEVMPRFLGCQKLRPNAVCGQEDSDEIRVTKENKAEIEQKIIGCVKEGFRQIKPISVELLVDERCCGRMVDSLLKRGVLYRKPGSYMLYLS